MKLRILAAMLAITALACSDVGGLPQDTTNDPGATGDDPPTDTPPPTDDPPNDDPPPPPPPPDPNDDGVIEARVPGALLLYRFKEGQGTTIEDLSDTLPAVPLTIEDPAAVQWLPNGGIELIAPTTIPAAAPIQKVFDACVASNEITIEAWVRTGNLDQEGPARIATYSIDTGNRNFHLGQVQSVANARLRTSVTGNNGSNPATDSNVDALSTETVRHVLYTRLAGLADLYIDGVKSATVSVGGNLENWNAEYQFALGNEITGDRPWLGELQMVAVYCKRLGSTQVEQNYAAGY